MKKALWTAILLGILSTQLWAVEASMCVSLTNTVCGNWVTTDYAIPAGQQITKTYFHYESPSTDAVRLECYYVNADGSTGLRIWAVNNNFCGCGSNATTIAHPISGGQTIRFRMWRTDCPGYLCVAGTSKVWFYTSATAVTCPPTCQPN